MLLCCNERGLLLFSTCKSRKDTICHQSLAQILGKGVLQSAKMYVKPFALKKIKEIYFCPAEPQSFANVCNG